MSKFFFLGELDVVQVCGRLKVELTRVLENEMKEADAGSLSDGENRDEMNDNENEPLGIPDHNEEISIGQTIAVKVPGFFSAAVTSSLLMGCACQLFIGGLCLPALY